MNSFGPESSNPRERRAYAHAMVAAHRRREVSFLAAERAVETTLQTRKGQESGLTTGLTHAASYSAVENVGQAYSWPSWPYPTGQTKEHYVFHTIEPVFARNPVKNGTEEAWHIVRDELVARGYGLHDAGYGGSNRGSIVAVVLDRELDLQDRVDIASEYALFATGNAIHQTSFC